MDPEDIPRRNPINPVDVLLIHPSPHQSTSNHYPLLSDGVYIQAVILAGGPGECLSPLTDTVPKPMVSIKGKPFLEHQLMLLKEHGVTDFVLLTGHLPNIIQEHFQDGAQFGIKIKYSAEDTPLGTGGAIKNADKSIEKDFLLIDGDTLLIINYTTFIRFYCQNKYPVVMITCNNRQGISPSNIFVDRDSMVTGYSKQNPVGMTHLDSGVLAINKKVFFKHMPNKPEFSFEQEVYPGLIREHILRAYQTNVRFHEIGTPDPLNRIAELL